MIPSVGTVSPVPGIGLAKGPVAISRSGTTILTHIVALAVWGSLHSTHGCCCKSVVTVTRLEPCCVSS